MKLISINFMLLAFFKSSISLYGGALSVSVFALYRFGFSGEDPNGGGACFNAGENRLNECATKVKGLFF